MPMAGEPSNADRTSATHRPLNHVPPQGIYEERSTPVSHFVDSAVAAFGLNDSTKAKIARFRLKWDHKRPE